MTFVFPILLGGLILVSIPVLLHLLLRQKPKTVLFPAFRFLVQRHKTNLTKLRLRHILLMAMRMLLLAAIVLALAQPKILDNPWNLPSDQAVAAVFVFDTSASMEYTVAASQTRLMDAKKRAVEMLMKVFPEHTEVVVLDSAETNQLGKGEWLSREKAAERIDQLKVQPASGAVTSRLAAALELLERMANSKDENQRGKRARALCVFSDRTPASWETPQRKSLQNLANRVPPNFERLSAVQSGIAEQLKLLAKMDQQLPQLSQSFPQQALIILLENLNERLLQLRQEEYPDTATQQLLAPVRAKQQELLSLLQQKENNTPPPSPEFQAKLTTALVNSLRSSAGFTAFYVDVGIEQPADLAVTDLQLTWEMEFAAPRLKLRAEARATGEDYRSNLVCDVVGPSSGVPFDVKSGKREAIALDLKDSQLQLGYHQARVTANPGDQLAINNTRYLTYAFRRVLILTDPEHDAAAQSWAWAIQANRFGAALYRCEIQSSRGFGDSAGKLDDYSAVFLCSLKSPEEKLWKALSEYVGKGGSVGVIPAGEEMKLDAYRIQAAQDVLPAEFKEIVRVAGRGADWDWRPEIYGHPMMHPYREWREGKFDFAVDPRGANRYWHVQPRNSQMQILVSYADGSGRPAMVERVVDLKRGRPGRVLLLTTPPGWRDWNNYAEDGNSFYVTLARQLIGYLTGDADRPSLNFLCGQGEPHAPIKIGSRAVTYKLYRDGATPPAALVGPVTVEAQQNEVRLPQAIEPGNFTLRNDDGDALAWFSINLAPEESDLTKISKAEIESVLGPETVLAVAGQANLKETMSGHVSQPWEMLPSVMLLLLFLLALENLLANKFYRREPAPALGMDKEPST